MSCENVLVGHMPIVSKDTDQTAHQGHLCPLTELWILKNISMGTYQTVLPGWLFWICAIRICLENKNLRLLTWCCYTEQNRTMVLFIAPDKALFRPKKS